MKYKQLYWIVPVVILCCGGFISISLAALWLGLGLISPVGPPAVLSAPDLAIYSGVYFASENGMERYDDITIVPSLLKGKVSLVLPDGASVDVCDITEDVLRTHNVQYHKIRDDGQGNFKIMVSNTATQIEMSSHRPVRIAMLSPTLETNTFSIKIKGQKVTVPIKRIDLEALLGPPDKIWLDTFPEDEK